MFTRFFSRKVVPTLLGKDVQIQFLHEEDLARALHQAIVEDHPGIYNLTGDDPVPMSTLLKTTHSIPIPMPSWLAKSGANLLFGIGLMPFSQAWVSMQEYPICVSSEKFCKEFGWRPRYSSQEAWMDFLRVWNQNKQKPA
jgi:UDP-glucose 4-epimerase